MDVEGIVIPITYRPVVLLAIGLWGWGLNLFILMRCGIDPISLLQLHQVDKHVPFYKPIFFLAGILSLIVLFNLWLYWYLTIPGIAALPYVSLLILLLWPGKAFYRKERIRFIRMLKRVLSLSLFSPVFFSDVILADMLTSFSNVFGDLFVGWCVIFTGHKSSYIIENTENLYYRDIMVPLLICTPYLIRLRQCLSEYIESKERRHLFNALKYTSSIPVILFSAIQRKASIYISEAGSVPDSWYLNETNIFRFWIVFVFMNSMYSFWWDISMDWNLLTITYTQAQSDENKPQKVQSSSPILHLRRQFYFSQPFWYFAAIVFDFLLRITWSLKLSSHIYIRKLDSSIFLMEFMEIARRWVWVIFRLESEWVKRVYNTLPLQATPLENLRMGLLDRKGGAGMLSPIEEESN